MRQYRLFHHTVGFLVGTGLKPVPALFLHSLLFFGILVGNTQAADQPELRVCLLEDNLPVSSRKHDSGFDLDVAKTVAEHLKQTLVPVWVKNDTAILEVEDSDFPLRRLGRNECDAIFSVPGPEAVKDSPKVAVGAPYYGAAFELIGRDGNAPSRLEALAKTPVAVQAQTIASFVLTAHNAQVRTFFSIEAALDALTADKAIVALLWGPSAGWQLRNRSETPLHIVAGYTPPAVVRWNEHVATRKSDTTLREAIDTALAQLTTSGALKTLMDRYGIPFHPPFETTYNLLEMEKLRGRGAK